jgi:hypothetical protein
MKKLKDLTNVDKINVSELMALKGGLVKPNPQGCGTHACNHDACTGASCLGNTCDNEACVTHMD